MALDRYQYGESVAVFADFKTGKKADPPNTFIDPAIVSLVIRAPDKTTVTRYYPTGVTKIDTGKYSSIIDLTQEGTYHGRWTGDNGPTQKGVKVFTFESVREPNF